MTLPDGQLRTRRVVADLGDILERVLDGELTGYLRLESDGLLLDDGGATALTFEGGVPVAAAHTERDSTGADALADAVVDGFYRFELHELDGDDFPAFHDHEQASVPPALPAQQLVGDPALVARTREAAPPDQLRETEGRELEAVESFLDDEEAIGAIRERARTEARERADEWGFETAGSDEHADSGR